jgi:hypothetical protein
MYCTIGWAASPRSVTRPEVQLGTDPERVQYRDLEAYAYLAELRSLLEDDDAEVALCQRQCAGQASDPATGNGNRQSVT